MTADVAQIAGIDIAKEHLDIHLQPSGAALRVTNDEAGLKQLLAWLRGVTITRVVFEATGAYHRELERTLAQAGLAYAKVNPRQVRCFAQALGWQAKTDRIDAKLLAHYGTLIEPRDSQPRSAAAAELCALVTARRALVKDRTAVLCRAKTLESQLLKRQATAQLRQIERHIAAIEQACRDLIAADEGLRAKLVILESIPGIGAATAAALLADMPELGQLDHKQVASLAGLAPITRESGTWKGKSFIRGGRPHLRRALYMPALVAMRVNPTLKDKYQALIAAGKPAKVAIVAVMRKLLILANALIRDGRNWSEKAA
jgi:transposase